MNEKMYKAYHEMAKRQPIFISGKRFVELILMKSYDEELFKNHMNDRIRYFIPRYSYELAMKKLSGNKSKLVSDTMASVSPESYLVYDPVGEVRSKSYCINESTDLALSALNLQKKYPNLQLNVSDEVWEKFRVASIQMQKDSDLL